MATGQNVRPADWKPDVCSGSRYKSSTWQDSVLALHTPVSIRMLSLAAAMAIPAFRRMDPTPQPIRPERMTTRQG